MQLTETQELAMKMAKVGYESYAKYTGNKSIVTGCELLKWEDLGASVRNSWFAAAEGMINFLASVKNIEVVDQIRGNIGITHPSGWVRIETGARIDSIYVGLEAPILRGG